MPSTSMTLHALRELGRKIQPRMPLEVAANALHREGHEGGRLPHPILAVDALLRLGEAPARRRLGSLLA